MTDQPKPAPQQWAIVELFGRDRLAGAVSNHTIGGETLLRIDVPEVSLPEQDFVSGQPTTVTRTIPAHTKLVGGKAIYSMAFVDEASALLAAHQIRHEPIKAWALRQALEQMTSAERRALLLDTMPSGGSGEEGHF